MKIRKLHFQNINSLRGEHQVDFTEAPLAHSGLFAITGPTGSGKSSLLDVICLALFNQVPRLGRISKNLILESGALLTRNQNEALASVEYQCQQGIFRSSWTISTARTGNLRDYEMEIYDLQKEQRLDLKKSDVPAHNEILIGLSYDQFVKSVMLAQGAFAEFLQAKKGERYALLEKITGTGIYRQLGARAFEKSREVAENLKMLRQKREDCRSELLPAEEYQALLEQREKQQKESKKLQAEKEELQSRWEKWQNWHKLGQRLQTQQKARDTAAGEWEAFAAREGERLRLHEATASFASHLQQWRDAQREIQRLEKEVEQAENELAQAEKERQKLLQTAERELQQEVPAEQFVETLDEFWEGVEQLDRQISELRQEYQNQRSRAEGYNASLELSLPYQEPEKGSAMLEKQASNLKERLQMLQKDMPADGDSPEKEVPQAREGLRLSEQYQDRQQQLSQVRDKMKKLEAELETHPGKIQTLEKEARELAEKREVLEQKIRENSLHAKLETHRQALEEGKPCPLCGSTEHPWAESQLAPDDNSQEELKELSARDKEVQRELVQRQTQLQEGRKQYRADKKSRDQLESDIQELQQKLAARSPEERRIEVGFWQERIAKLESQQRAREEKADLERQQQAVDQLLPCFAELQRLQKAGREVAGQRKKRFADKTYQKDIKPLQDQWNSLHYRVEATQKQKADLQKQADARRSHLREVEKMLQPHLAKAGLNNPQEALQQRLPEEQYQEWTARRQNLRDQLKERDQELESIRQQRAELQEALQDQDEESLRKRRSEVDSALEALHKELEELNWKVKNHQRFLEKLAALDQELQEAEKGGRKWELLGEMIGDRNGTRFNNFAQELTLRQLLVLANRRLQQLSDRYLTDRPGENESDQLVVIDRHMGDQRRSIQTLSGGETFMLSLALALALSDLAAQNVRIESLFIDEGFGTLDAESLDHTIDTLERLQADSNKTIGIISHVDSLKERIQTQLQLDRDGQGYSSLVVKA